MHAHFEPQIPPSQQHNASSSSPFSIPRARVNSIMNRGLEAAQSFTSPLAQIFQPLVVDDDTAIQEEPQDPSQPLVSFGPASRRRLSSMQGHRRVTTDSGNGVFSGSPHKGHSPLKRFPILGSESGDVLSTSPPSISESPGRTAGQLKDGEADSGGVEQRIAEIEGRQIRMEKLLERIAKSLDVDGEK